MTPDWTVLTEELARWRAVGLTLPLWWRDDDAVAMTPALERLAALSARLGMPLHLAVIPAHADETLAEAVAAHPNLVPLVHGWTHENHAPAEEKKAEFGAHRPRAAMRADTELALARTQALFGARLRPVFVPPWNRIAPDLLPDLAAQGYAAVSTFTPRKTPLAAPGLLQINTHLDPIAWKTTRGLADPDTLIAQIARQLADRREGRADNAEPYGVLTHHLVHDDAIWSFAETLLARLLDGPTWRWTFPAPPAERTGT
ncbi:polysaccharide deacetylase family protein [Jhaorihella thermophila]|uniref:Polysaccharide deacetylase n=1 Tax=Jhaorihella thermophila TaxID=488547 RepID=A0A1H5TVI6_9RHOB|nr:polysaccharide deacetylase family protein [Jhaorihella thermophila]SEF66780.1 hypothetical protein SAMN05421751_10346 [Jhaorihella thermophila]